MGPVPAVWRVMAQKVIVFVWKMEGGCTHTPAVGKGRFKVMAWVHTGLPGDAPGLRGAEGSSLDVNLCLVPQPSQPPRSLAQSLSQLERTKVLRLIRTASPRDIQRSGKVSLTAQTGKTRTCNPYQQMRAQQRDIVDWTFRNNRASRSEASVTRFEPVAVRVASRRRRRALSHCGRPGVC